VGGLVAQVERELTIVDDLAGGVVEAGFFEPHGAMTEPVMLGHDLDERFFAGCGGLVLLLELSQELVELGLGFGTQHPEFAGGGEAVTEVVARGGGFSRLILDRRRVANSPDWRRSALVLTYAHSFAGRACGASGLPRPKMLKGMGNILFRTFVTAPPRSGRCVAVTMAFGCTRRHPR